MDICRKMRGGVSRKEIYILCVWRKEVASSQATPRFYFTAGKFSPRLRDKGWEWPGDEARYKSERDLIV